MKIGAIIPARYESSRFRGKPLAKISGISMIERVYRQVLKSEKFEEIIVAIDSDLIAEEVDRFNGKFVMTSPDCSSGTERVWEVLKDSDLDSAINIQGDEPLISEKLISEIYVRLEQGGDPVVTAAYFNESLDDFNSVNVVKSVFDANGNALYFSRSPIPGQQLSGFSGFYHHVGIYGYTRDALSSFFNLPPSKMEQMEKLEQLRFIENGINICVIKTDYRSIGVDVPQDIEKIEKLLKE
ncbi:MAG: 3-deoxy-manno-octulosonate cytidylyltransferase [Candidatus Aminicenantes bacterium]|nr:3-deoxy-manno-octulosonate cytidylyltransferase [Candidatus Aminicenantes bacterium]